MLVDIYKFDSMVVVGRGIPCRGCTSHEAGEPEKRETGLEEPPWYTSLDTSLDTSRAHAYTMSIHEPVHMAGHTSIHVCDLIFNN